MRENEIEKMKAPRGEQLDLQQHGRKMGRNTSLTPVVALFKRRRREGINTEKGAKEEVGSLHQRLYCPVRFILAGQVSAVLLY